MTSNNKQHLTSIRKLFALILAITMCISLVFAVACSKETTATKLPEFSYSDVDNGTISNASFDIGTSGVNYTSFPKTTVNGWSISKSSSAKSGVINTSDEGWKQLMTNLYSDSGILNYIKARYGFDTDDVKTWIKEQEGYDQDKTPTSSEIKDYIIKHYLDKSAKDSSWADTYAFTNPKTASDLDDNVYMLNNYKSNESFGSIQKLTSSTEITLEKGQYAKISVWVKTANINQHTNYGQVIGANIRIQNSFAGNSQQDFGVYNILDTEWTQYSFYVKADDVYDTKFTVVLGLGYDDYKAEGTVYFDDVQVELLDEILEEDLNKLDEADYNISYKAETNDYLKIPAETAKTKIPLYDMTIDFADIDSYTKDNVTSFNTVSEINTPYANINEGTIINLDTPSSYTLKLDNNGNNFSVDKQSYTALSFFIKNQLNKLYSTNVTINVVDVKGDATETRQITTISDVSDEWQKCTVVVKNNFENENGDNREFYVEIIVGPNTTPDNVDDYALGKVTISNAFYAQGSTKQFDDNDNKTANYDYFKFFESTANGSTALYAGSSSDFVADEDDVTSYSLTVAPSDLGTITTAPAQPKNFTGITPNHFYIDGPETNNEINTNTQSGLINTNYLEKYGTDVTNALGFTKTEDNVHIQPLMINTKGSTTNYGFISDKYTVSASSYASVSVKVRAFGDAVAYIYLIDIDSENKAIMTFDQFKDTNDKTIEQKSLYFEVKDTTNEDDGWKTVTFYFATGANAKNFRVEVWNGARDAQSVTNQGIVFFNDISVTTSSAFTEPTRYQEAITSSGTPLTGFESDQLYLYQRQLTDIEKQYNNDSDKKGDNISYQPTYIWAQSDTMIYAIYNTVDPVVVNPYDSEVEDEEETEEETQVDPAAFWLSLSSIVLGVVLLGAIIMLFVKNIRRRRKANASDAKSHFKVVSRTKKPTQTKAKKTKSSPTSKEKDITEEVKESEKVESVPAVEQSKQVETAPVEEQSEKVEDEVKELVEETEKEVEEPIVEEQPNNKSENFEETPAEEQPVEEILDDLDLEKQLLDSYIYGEVQNFGENSDEDEKQ